MNKFISFATDEGYSYLGTYKNMLYFVKAEDAEIEKNSFVLFSVDKEKCDNFNEESFASEGYWVTNPVRSFEEKPEDDNKDDDKDEDTDDKCDCKKEDMAKELEACKTELESCKAELKAKCEELETIRMEKVKEAATEVLAAEEDMDEDEKEKMKAEITDGKFASEEAFIRELSYRKYSKQLQERTNKNTKSATFTIYKNETPTEGAKPTGLDLI